MTERTRHRLAAILAADIVGYSRMVAADEASTLAAMHTLRSELWEPLTETHGGRLVGTAGDSRLVEFPSAIAAVECAVATQQAMAERNADLPEDRRVRLRIGVNLGDVAVDGDDILGNGVNVAARLETEAKPNGICISDDVIRQIRGRLDLECQSAFNSDPLSACKIDPPPCFDGGCPGSPREGPARLRVALCVTRSEAAWEGPVGPPGQPGRRRNVGIRWGS